MCMCELSQLVGIFLMTFGLNLQVSHLTPFALHFNDGRGIKYASCESAASASARGEEGVGVGRCRMTTLAKSPCEVCRTVSSRMSRLPLSIPARRTRTAWMDAFEIYRVESIFDRGRGRTERPTLATDAD